MNAAQREQIRLSVLRYCDAADPYGLADELLLQFIRSEGFRTVTAAQLRAELQYLTDKSLLTAVPKTISPENSAWRITAAGRDFLAMQNPDKD
jgi:hypothetical protein